MRITQPGARTLFIAFCLAAAASTAAAADVGTLLVLNKSDNTVSIVSLASQADAPTVPTGHGPHEVAVSPDGKIAVVTNYGQQSQPGNSLTVIDVAAARVLRTISLNDNRRPHGIAWLGGSRVAVTTEDSKSLLVVDVEAGKVLSTIPTGQDVSHMVVVSPKHQRAFVANIGSGSMTVIDLAAGRHVANIPTGAGAEGIDISPDEREVWVTNREADTVSIVDVATLNVAATVPSRGMPIRAKFTPDGKHVMVSNARAGEVSVFEAATRKEARRIPMQAKPGSAADSAGRMFAPGFGGGGPVPVGILVAPALKHAYVANTNADIVSVIDLETWQLVDALRAGKEPDGLGYSPLTRP